MHTSMIDVSSLRKTARRPQGALAKAVVHLLGVIGICVLAGSSLNALAQQAPQRPLPSNADFVSGTTNVNSNFNQTRDRPLPAAPQGSGQAVNGGTAGVVINNYNSNYNTVSVAK